MPPDEYNIAHYYRDVSLEARQRFPSHSLRVGMPPLDFRLPILDQLTPLLLSEAWHQGPLLLVFGCLTAPPCLAELPALETLWQRYQKRATFLLVYTREIHPGEHLPPHRSMKQKEDHARLLRDRCSFSFPIALDDLQGSCHLAYGGLPSMAVLIDSGMVVLRSEWTDCRVIGWCLDQLASARSGGRSAYHEWLGQSGPERPEMWHEIMSAAGEDALIDYQRERAGKT